MLGMLYLQVTKYEGNRKLEWDNFAKSSKNGHFFFYRDYMEYHSDRFQDFSLIIYNYKGNIMALLPASIDGDTVISHGGLTFGGFVCDSKMTAAKMLDVFASVKHFLKNAGVRMFIYKCTIILITINDNDNPHKEDTNASEIYTILGFFIFFSIFIPNLFISNITATKIETEIKTINSAILICINITTIPIKF